RRLPKKEARRTVLARPPLGLSGPLSAVNRRGGSHPPSRLPVLPQPAPLRGHGQRRRLRRPVFRYRPRWVVTIRPSFFHAKAMLAARVGVTPVSSRNSFVVKVFPRRS